MALIMARAYVASRTLDYALAHLSSSVDITKVAISGHSRNGKQSVVAAAFDDRGSMANPDLSLRPRKVAGFWAP